MTIDPTGINPGLAAGAQEETKPVFRKCRNPRCDSNQVNEIKLTAPEHIGHRVYKCVKCGHVESLMVGGAFNL